MNFGETVVRLPAVSDAEDDDDDDEEAKKERRHRNWLEYSRNRLKLHETDAFKMISVYWKNTPNGGNTASEPLFKNDNKKYV